jgi:hypothetical protein
MITPNLQQTLFMTGKEEALVVANTTEALANLWFKQNYLSFDISKITELKNYEVLELRFLSHLFKSNLDLETINKLLDKLAKPYAYDYKEVYFNVFSNTWQYLPVEIDEEVLVETYLENLNTEDDREKIEEIIKNLQALLK